MAMLLDMGRRRYTPIEHMSVTGETDGANTSGVFSLTSEAFQGSVSYIKLDKSVRLRIWAKHISGAPVTLVFEKTEDVTAQNPTWSPVEKHMLPSNDLKAIELRQPVEITFRTGKEAIRISWEQATAGKSYVEFVFEIVPEEYG